MRKEMIKKLFTYYQVECNNVDEVRNDPNHIFYCYSSHVATCIKYHNTFVSWINEIVNSKFKNGFGIKFLTEDGKHKVDTSLYNIDCSPLVCRNNPEDYIAERMAIIIDYYFNLDPYYYEVYDDNVYLISYLTGHRNYNSPYESYDSCGTCDGAKCDYCKEKYLVEDMKTGDVFYNGLDKEEAIRIERKHSTDYAELINDILENYNINKEWYDNNIKDTTIKYLMNLLQEYKIPYVQVINNIE